MVNWIQKRFAKLQIRASRNRLSKWKAEKLSKDTEKEKNRLAEAIMAMSEMIQIEEEDGTPTGREQLKKKTVDELIELMEMMMDEAEKNL